MRRLSSLLLLVLSVPSVTSAATLVLSRGSVSIARGERREPARQGAELKADETLITDEGGLAVVALTDGSRLKLNERSRLVLDEKAAPPEARLESGSVFARIRKQAVPSSQSVFRVRTRTAVMGVRGTEFFTSYANRGSSELKDVWMCVREGLVTVERDRDAPPIAVRAGQGLHVPAQGEIAPPRPFEWTRGLNWKMDADDGDLVNHAAAQDEYRDVLLEDYD